MPRNGSILLICNALAQSPRANEGPQSSPMVDTIDGAGLAAGTHNMAVDARRMAPAAARNREPITSVLRRHLPSRGLVLEVASGTGEHIAHFASALGSGLIFQPSDADAGARASIDAWVEALGVGNVRPAIGLDASAENWPVQAADVVICINMIHIAPWTAAVGLVRGAAQVLPAGGLLYLYGPFRRDGRHTAPSNEAFDGSLRAQNAEWGVRDLEAVAELAAAHGFSPPVIEEMPANNLSLIFSKAGVTPA
jgi:SAM-dependent methyltransferase